MLVVAGSFSLAGTVATANMALWDGVTWSSPGGGWPLYNSTGISDPSAIAEVDFDGEGPAPAWLVVAGGFSSNSRATQIMAWDGASWINLALPRLDARVIRMVSVDPDGPAGPVGGSLFVLTNYGIIEFSDDAVVTLPAAGPVATWSAAGLAAWDPDGPGPASRRLVAALNVTESGQPARVVLLPWLGNAWGAELGSFLGVTQDLATADFDGAGPAPESLLVASSGSTGPVMRLAGGTWNRMGTAAGSANQLVVTTSGGTEPSAVCYLSSGVLARWNGSDWESLPSSSEVLAAALYDVAGSGEASPRLIVGGRMAALPSNGPQVGGIAQRMGQSWQPLTAGTNGEVRRTVPWDHDADPATPARIVAAGSFSQIGGAATGPIAVRSGNVWTGIGYSTEPASTGYSGPVGVFDPDGAGPLLPRLFVSSRFDRIGGTAARNIAQWNGSAFAPLSGGIDCSTTCAQVMLVFDADGSGPAPAELIIGGLFSAGQGLDNVTRWNGTAWRTMDGGVNGAVTHLALWDLDGDGPNPPRLVAGGAFTGSGTVPLAHLGLWDGTHWTALPPNGPTTIYAMASWDPDGAGPIPPRLVVSQGAQVMICDGASWSLLGSQFRLAQNPAYVRVLKAVDTDRDGFRPQILLAGGEFDLCGFMPMRNLAVWRERDWWPLGYGCASPVTGIEPFDPDGTGPEPTRLLLSTNSAAGTPSANPSAVSIVGLPPWVAESSDDAERYPNGEAVLEVVLDETGLSSFQWRKDQVALVDGTSPAGSMVAGVGTSRLVLSELTAADSGRYSCLVINACGTTLSRDIALLVVCPADFDRSGGVDGDDVRAFFLQWEAGNTQADLNADGGVDGSDIELFFRVWEAGTC